MTLIFVSVRLEQLVHMKGTNMPAKTGKMQLFGQKIN